MSKIISKKRKKHLLDNWLAWAALHHFLPAPLLRELSYVIVEHIGGGKLSFKRLFDEVTPEGPSAFATWLIQPRQTSSQLAKYLQYRIRSFTWQSDEGGFLSLVRDDMPDAVGPSLLERAVELGATDYFSCNVSMETETDFNQTSMQHFIRAFVLARSSFMDKSTDDFMKELDSSLQTVEMPLLSIMLKHFGDLCADADEWDKARRIYEKVNHQFENFSDPVWSEFVQMMKEIVTQSHATAIRTLHSAKDSAGLLNVALSRNTITTASLLHGNASFDAFVATSQANADIFPSDLRASILLPPLLHNTHDTAAAMGNWLNGKFNDANKRFWAVLRRQIALGLATESRATKAWYGRSLISEIEQTVGRNERHTFNLASRLLVESGICEAVSKINWTVHIISSYVDQSSVDFIIKHAEIHEGAKIERQLVVIELFREWTNRIPLESKELASSMLKYVAALAHVPASFHSNQNVGGNSLKVLQSLAKERPEFRQLIIPEIVSIFKTHLQAQGFWTGTENALKLVSEYLEVFAEKDLLEVVESTLSMLEETKPKTGMWPIIRPAMWLLVSSPVKRFIKHRSDLGQRILDIVLRFGLEQESESTNVLFYLHNFDPALLNTPSIQESLQDTVKKVRQKATKINSSDVVDQIQALLLAPTLAGPEGIDEALQGLTLILDSAIAPRHSFVLAYAYDALLLLINNGQKIADALNMTLEQFRDKLKPIYPLVIQLWQEATKRPLILASFSFDQATKPDKIIVHNWAFASMSFAEMLQDIGGVEKVLVTAAVQPMLADGIALARATKSVAEKSDIFDVDSIRLESRETFYSVLGRRLVILQRLSAEQGAELCNSLVHQCLNHGPSEIDAAVFLEAIRLDLCGYGSALMYSNYKKRLESKRDLRLTLMPILQAMNYNGEADDDE